MRIDLKRLSALLSPFCFQLAYFDSISLDIAFVRKTDQLFESIEIKQGWQRGAVTGDLVGAWIGCSVVPGRTALKGLGEIRFLNELASDENGDSFLVDAESAMIWEKRLAEFAPNQAANFCAQIGPQLLEQTYLHRAAVTQYFDRVWHNEDITQNLKLLQAVAKERDLMECRRILARPIIMIPDGTIYYELAALAIVLHCGEIDGNPLWTMGRLPDVDTDRSLMIRLQILASRFAKEPGW